MIFSVTGKGEVGPDHLNDRPAKADGDGFEGDVEVLSKRVCVGLGEPLLCYFRHRIKITIDGRQKKGPPTCL